MFCQRAQSETIPYRLLLFGVDVVGVTSVDRDSETGVGSGGRRDGLGFARFRPIIAVNRNGAAFGEGGQADDIERKIALAEERAPIGNHRRKDFAVLKTARRVLFSLIPNRTG